MQMAYPAELYLVVVLLLLGLGGFLCPRFCLLCRLHRCRMSHILFVPFCLLFGR